MYITSFMLAEICISARHIKADKLRNTFRIQYSLRAPRNGPLRLQCNASVRYLPEDIRIAVQQPRYKVVSAEPRVMDIVRNESGHFCKYGNNIRTPKREKKENGEGGMGRGASHLVPFRTLFCIILLCPMNNRFVPYSILFCELCARIYSQKRQTRVGSKTFKVDPTFMQSRFSTVQRTHSSALQKG